MGDRPFFSSKTKKIDGRTTLDNLHQLQFNELKKKKEDSQQLSQKIKSLKEEIHNCQDIILKTKKEEQLGNLQQQLDDWQSDKPIFDYFFETGDILYKYYDLQEKVLKGETNGSSGKFIKAKPGSVLAALQSAEEEQEIQPEKEKEKEKEGREVLLHKYLQKVDPEAAHTSQPVSEDVYDICDVCDSEMIFSPNEALFYCNNCGHTEFVLIDSDKPSYKDPPREVTYYAYKRINHFNELLAQYQAKESTEIPDDVFQAILEELKKERVISPESIKESKIREILKKLKLTSFYEHIPYILNRINGRTMPIMTREIEDKLRFMFKEIQASFIKHCPTNRSNFLSYSYVLYKFCELLELDEYLPRFPLLKNRDKLYAQDKIWQLICADMRWQYVRSI